MDWKGSICFVVLSPTLKWSKRMSFKYLIYSILRRTLFDLIVRSNRVRRTIDGILHSQIWRVSQVVGC